MHKSDRKTPIGNLPSPEAVVRTTTDLGALIRDRRQELQLRQVDIAGLGNTGNRFIVDLESGKPTIQLQKALDIISLLGLELVVRRKTGSGL